MAVQTTANFNTIKVRSGLQAPLLPVPPRHPHSPRSNSPSALCLDWRVQDANPSEPCARLHCVLIDVFRTLTVCSSVLPWPQRVLSEWSNQSNCLVFHCPPSCPVNVPLFYFSLFCLFRFPVSTCLLDPPFVLCLSSPCHHRSEPPFV